MSREFYPGWAEDAAREARRISLEEEIKTTGKVKPRVRAGMLLRQAAQAQWSRGNRNGTAASTATAKLRRVLGDPTDAE